MPGDNLSLFSPNGTWKYKVPGDGMLTDRRRHRIHPKSVPKGLWEPGREGGCWWGIGEGRSSNTGLTLRVHGRLRNRMCPGVGWEEVSPRCSARWPGQAWLEARSPGTGREGGQQHPARLNAGPAATGRPG